MIQPELEKYGNINSQKHFLIGQLGSYGDCLWATTIACQIKTDYPDCHLTWAVGSIYRSILNGNPYIDEIWEIPLSSRSDLSDRWQEFEDEAILRRNNGIFDEIFLTQIFPNNIRNFDGTLRSSIFRAYNKPITVSVSPIISLLPREIENVRDFVEAHHLNKGGYVILFECSPKSGQSFVTIDFAIAVSKKLIRIYPDLYVILSTNDPIYSVDKRIIDGSELSFRENAELTKYCSLLIGCSSGLSWLCTSDWANPLPMVQLLKKETCMYASLVHDHEYHSIRSDSIIEMTECSIDQLSHCIEIIRSGNFDTARRTYHEQIQVNFYHYATVISLELLQNGKFKDALISICNTLKRYGFRPQLFICFILFIMNTRWWRANVLMGLRKKLLAFKFFHRIG